MTESKATKAESTSTASKPATTSTSATHAAPATAAKSESTKTASAPGARASESGDADVQRLLAEKQTAQMNGDDEGVKAVDKQLRDLGFTE